MEFKFALFILISSLIGFVLGNQADVFTDLLLAPVKAARWVKGRSTELFSKSEVIAKDGYAESKKVTEKGYKETKNIAEKGLVQAKDKAGNAWNSASTWIADNSVKGFNRAKDLTLSGAKEAEKVGSWVMHGSSNGWKGVSGVSNDAWNKVVNVWNKGF